MNKGKVTFIYEDNDIELAENLKNEMNSLLNDELNEIQRADKTVKIQTMQTELNLRTQLRSVEMTNRISIIMLIVTIIMLLLTFISVLPRYLDN